MSDSFSPDLVLSPLQLGYGEKYLMFTLQVTMTATALLSQVTKHLRPCFHFCKFYNNQTRPGDKPRSFASDCDIITTSLVIDRFFTSSICASTTKGNQHSPILHCK